METILIVTERKTLTTTKWLFNGA